MLDIQKKLSNLFYIILSLPATSMGFALSIQIAVLSWILSTRYNLNIHDVGIVWAAGPIAGILGQVIIGFISDKVWFWGGRRRPFIIIGGILAAMMIVALPYIGEINEALSIHSLMTVAIIVAVTLDMSINISFNPTRSLIADVTPDGIPRTKGYTWMQTISGFFGVFAYVFGAVFGNYALIWFGAILILLFSIIPTLLIKETRVLQATSNVDDKTHLPENKTIKWAGLLKIYFAHSFTWLGIQTMFVYIFAYIAQFQYGISNMALLNESQNAEIVQIISISFAIMNTIGFILPAFVLQPFVKKLGNVKVHLLCIVIMALGYWGIVAFGNNAIKLYMLMAIVGIGWASVVSLPFAIMTQMVDKSKMGLFMGIFNLSIVIPQLIVSLFIGSLIQSAKDKIIIFIISAVALSISAILWLFIKEPTFRTNKQG